MKIRLLNAFILFLLAIGAHSQITTVGIIGSATPGGWDTDTDMIQDATDTAIWTLNLNLSNGEAKFRANDDWAINWGASDFPIGVGVPNGPNIPVNAGNYDVTFNSVTGEYNLAVNSPIGIIGSATPGGWDNDTNMYFDSSGFFYTTLALTVGECKFRANDDWVINWGAMDFPTGTGVQDGPNVPIALASTYYITLDTVTGAYSFTEMVSYGTVGIIGSSTPGGWDEDTDMIRDPADPNKWSLFIELLDGEAKFRAEDDWVISWGAEDFPVGVGTLGGPNIPVVAGYYRVDFNSETGDYSFTSIGNYETVGIIGDATPGGWATDTDMIQDEADPTIWRLSLSLLDGEAKFRANDDWPINWGGAEFPIGVAVQDGANIPVTAGDYHVTFNSLTGEYSFELFVVYDQISLVGNAGPFGDWPGTDDMGAKDTYMTQDLTDNQAWSLSNVALVDAPESGGIKFRANTAWTINWGAADFPSGIGTQDGPNILCTAGNYDVYFNSLTGEYLFTPTTGTEEVLNPNDITLYPNPVSDRLAIDISSLNATGKGDVTIVDMKGSIIQKSNIDLSSTLNVDVSNVPTGNYFLTIRAKNFVIAKRFAIVK